MGRLVFIGLMSLGITCAFTAAVMGCLAAWFSDERFGGIGGVLFFVALLSALICGIWSDEGIPSRRLPRQERRRVREEQARIAADAEIERMEREAGIR